MPEVGQEVLAIMNLHARCRNNKALPASGGILDQPAYLMDLFDVIDGVRSDFQNKDRERITDDAIKARQLEGLRHGR